VIVLLIPMTAIAARPEPLTDEQILKNRVIDVMARLATARIRNAPDPTRSDYEAAARSFDLIRTLDPVDIDLLRRGIEAWTAAGDGEIEIERTRELLKLDPTDTYAQLRVTLAGLSRLQNADDRLAAYGKLLGDRGAALDPSVRSRLALDAALLARDNGDDRLNVEYLTLAATLDPTNKEAAALFAGNLLPVSSDPFERVDILCNVILSDPLDPSAYENLALELLQYGAFSSALRNFRLSTGINDQLGRQINEDRIFDFALCEWNAEGPNVALNRLMVVLRDTMLAEQARRQRIIDDGLDPGPESPMILPPRLQLLRLAIAASDKNSPELVANLKTILADYTTVNSQAIAFFRKRLDDIAALDEPDNIVAHLHVHPVDRMIALITMPRSIDKIAETNTQMQLYKLQRLWAQLAAGDQLEDAAAFIDELDAERIDAETNGVDPTKAPPVDAEVIQRYRGWLLVMQHEDAEAERLLTPLVEKDHLARWALGLLKEQQGVTAEAIKHYAILARDQPTTALGSTAFFRLQALVDKPVIRSAVAADLDKRVAAFAPWLETITSDPTRFMSAHIDIAPENATTFDRPVITITVRNTSRWPLGVGTTRPIPKRMLLAPRIRIDGRDASRVAGPFVALLSSRLRLEPAAEVSVEVHPLREAFGTMLDNAAGDRIDARWQLLQNFVSDEGTFKASPLTITAMSNVLTRPPLNANVTVEELVERLGKNEGLPLITDVLVAGDIILAHSGPKSQDDPAILEQRLAIANALIARIPTAPEFERSLIIARCAELSMQNDPTLSAALNDALANETAPFPLLAAITSLATTSESPLFDRAEASGNPDVARIATLIRESLQALESPPAPPDTDDASAAPSTGS